MQPLSFEVRDQWAKHNPALDTSSMEIVALIKWISAIFDIEVGPLYEGAPLTMSELDLLLPLRYSSGPIIARRLAFSMKLSPAAISKTMAHLEERGYISRQPCPTNHRAALVFITDKGKKAIDSIFPHQLAIESALLSGLGSDRKLILDALHRLYDVIESSTKPKMLATP
jgi:DNA-binding MarR family transcriptional regulator